MKISIVVPLFDRRDAGWSALQSALDQPRPRRSFEVIAVTGADLDGGAGDAELARLLARCDAVARIEADGGNVAHEIRYYEAGVERATGDVLYFIEGHTVLERRCCAAIATFFARHPDVELAWAPRINRGETPLGALVSMHNLRHEARAVANGVFSLGANSVITRRLFDRLGGFASSQMRFSETALFHRALRAGVAIGHIAEPLATHHNDMPVRHWRELVTTAGAARFAYYDALRAQGEDLRDRVRHPVYLLANTPPVARALGPLSRFAGRALLTLALRATRVSTPIAYRLYVLALGFTDLAGYCGACASARAAIAVSGVTERAAPTGPSYRGD